MSACLSREYESEDDLPRVRFKESVPSTCSVASGNSTYRYRLSTFIFLLVCMLSNLLDNNTAAILSI